MKSVLAFFTFIFIITLLSLQNSFSEQGKEREMVILPDLPWSLFINLKGYEIIDRGYSDDANLTKLEARNGDYGITVFITIEKGKYAADNKVCRDYYLDKMKKNKTILTDTILKEYKQFEILEYSLINNDSVKLKYRIQNAFLSKDFGWLSIKMTKDVYKPEDSAIFNNILNYVVIQPNEYPPAYYCYVFGLKFFQDKEYRKSNGFFRKAFNFEKRERKLNDNVFNELVDYYGISFAMLFNLEKAYEIFDYGISKDSTYPMFYYHKAYYYAQTNDMDRFAQYLEKALKLKGNLPKEKYLPDPRNDELFSSFISNKKFEEILKKLGY
jgi:hypothetical protein